ncbi:MAG TPA: NAD-dependent succinate-semialdehyde dehydrogenase [Sphingomicrobium sp.]|nr:NAD-dependent succinate-semialdehyde dehydrogenase [Sphingomicrobium sp.]
MAEQAELTRPEEKANKLQTVNPATGRPGKSYAQDNIEVARTAARSAHCAFLEWRRTSFAERGAMLHKAADILRSSSDALSALMTEEMGKTTDEGRAEVEKCAFHCDWFADKASSYLADAPVDIGGGEAFVTFNPIGVILAVMPWNFPLWQVFRAAAPALMAGNGMLLKHASNVPGCALAIADILRQAGLPNDLFCTLLLPSSEVEALIKDDNVAAVTLTGSVPAGRSVATAAGSVLKKCVLELGGSDAYVVLEDADVKAAAKVAATARMVNGGQSCIAGKRFVVVRSIIKEFEEALVEEMRGFTMGDPTQAGTKLGPMVSVKARDEIHNQVEASIAKGARLLLGGYVPDGLGAWYPATVLSDVGAGQPAHDEEVFGPVAAIIAAADEREAIEIANGSEFGLGSGVLTSNIDRGRRIASQELVAGMSFVNENVRSDPRTPFGGVKNSGYGRECGIFGIREFVNIKTVHVKAVEHASATRVE